MRGLLLLIAAATPAAFLACGGSSGGDNSGPTPIVSRAEDPIQVVVTSPVFADFVREIGGENVSVVSLLSEGANPHTYEPSLDQAAVVAGADVILVNGLGLEGPLLDFLQRNRPERPHLFVVFAANVPSPTTQQPVDRPIYATEAGDDPHLWLDPQLASIYPETVADSLAILDGENRPFYQAMFLSYQGSLEKLDAEIRDSLGAIPQDRRLLAVYHDSFVHFARRYGLETAAVATSDLGEPLGPAEATEFVRKAQGAKAPAVFAEVGFERGSLELASQDANVSLCALYSDTLDEGAGTYMEMMRANTRELVRCLGR